MSKTFETIDRKNEVVKLSRWISVKQNYNVRKNNSLYDFSTDENGYKPYEKNYDPKNGTYLDYFTFKGKNYAIEQFICIGSAWCAGKPYMFIDTDGKISVVGAVDFYGDLYDPLYIELDAYCEKVRVYRIK